MPAFSDALLIEIVIKAARRVNRKLCLFGTSDEIVINPSTGEISAPASELPDGEELYDLVLLQAECLITQREFQSELRNSDGGVLVVDGEQRVDTRAAGVARGTFFDSEHSPCAELKEAILIEKMRRAGGEGKLVW